MRVSFLEEPVHDTRLPGAELPDKGHLDLTLDPALGAFGLPHREVTLFFIRERDVRTTFIGVDEGDHLFDLLLQLGAFGGDLSCKHLSHKRQSFSTTIGLVRLLVKGLFQRGELLLQRRDLLLCFLRLFSLTLFTLEFILELFVFFFGLLQSFLRSCQTCRQLSYLHPKGIISLPTQLCCVSSLRFFD